MTPSAFAIERDFLNRRLASFLLWQGPAILMLAVAIANIENPTRGMIWAGCLSIFGVGCLVNAFRSGRRHCFLTGPFYLLMGVVSLLHGFALIALGPLGWLLYLRARARRKRA